MKTRPTELVENPAGAVLNGDVRRPKVAECSLKKRELDPLPAKWSALSVAAGVEGLCFPHPVRSCFACEDG